MDITGYNTSEDTYRIKVGVESVLSTVCLRMMLAQQS